METLTEWENLDQMISLTRSLHARARKIETLRLINTTRTNSTASLQERKSQEDKLTSNLLMMRMCSMELRTRTYRNNPDNLNTKSKEDSSSNKSNLLMMRMCSMDLRTRNMAPEMSQQIWMFKFSITNQRLHVSHHLNHTITHNLKEKSLSNRAITAKSSNYERSTCQETLLMISQEMVHTMLCKIRGTLTKKSRWRTTPMFILI